MGFSEELGQIGSPGHFVFGLRIVIRTVKGMAPVVRVIRKGLDQFSVFQQGYTLRVQDAQDFLLNLRGGFSFQDQKVDQIIRQVQVSPVACFDIDA